MRKSARILGQEYGLTSQEMNFVLKEEGYLNGDAGNYSVTDKGVPFAEETDYHRGTGGYSHYNRYWTTRTWDESIEEDLNITNDMKEAARDAVAKVRKQNWDEIKAARKKADEDFTAKNNPQITEEVKETVTDSSGALGVGLLIGGLIVVGYGIYKVAPHVINWWKDRGAPTERDFKKAVNKKVRLKEMICPACGDIMKPDDVSSIWECNNCNYSISHAELKDGTVFSFCDKCESFMNIQTGFNTDNGNWICTECGFDNEVTDVNIK